MREIKENDLKKLLNSNEYITLKNFDFVEYDRLIRNKKRLFFKDEYSFQDYKKSMLKGIAKGKYNLPVLVYKNNKLFIKDGYVRLLTCKLLGIDPVIDIIQDEMVNV